MPWERSAWGEVFIVVCARAARVGAGGGNYRNTVRTFVCDVNVSVKTRAERGGREVPGRGHERGKAHGRRRMVTRWAAERDYGDCAADVDSSWRK